MCAEKYRDKYICFSQLSLSALIIGDYYFSDSEDSTPMAVWKVSVQSAGPTLPNCVSPSPHLSLKCNNVFH